MNVTFSTHEGIGSIVLDNPPSNQLDSPQMVNPEKLRAFFDNPALRAVILKGAGRHFCAGADLDMLKTQSTDPVTLAADLDKGKVLLDSIRFAPVPVAAVIRGSCLGAGLEIALACHFRFAAQTAMLGFPESEQGIMPGMSGTFALYGGREGRIQRNKIAESTLVDLMVSGKMVNGTEALDLGLVTHCSSTGAVEEDAVAFLGKLVDGRSTLQIRSIMAALHNAFRLPREDALREESRLFCELVGERERGTGT